MSEQRSRRGEKTRIEKRLDRLIAEADTLGAGREHRREALVERAEARGVGRPEAERAYDLALEEGLEPAWALALVGAGISVQMLGDGPPAEAAEAVEPEWIDRPPSAEEASRERRLRETFRRLRSFMDDAGGPRDALTRFAREPDLEAYDF